jgi:hypothetical protein
MKTRIALALALGLMLICTMPAAAGWEVGVGFGVGLLSQSSGIAAKTVIDDLGESYDLAAHADAVARVGSSTTWLITPALLRLAGTELRAELAQESYAGILGGGTTQFTRMGVLGRWQQSDRLAWEYGLARNAGAREIPVSVIHAAIRPPSSPLDPGIEIGSVVLPVGEAVYARATAAGYELSVGGKFKLAENLALFARLRQGFGSEAGAWSYHTHTRDGAKYPLAYPQLPSLALNGTALTAGALLTF